MGHVKTLRLMLSPLDARMPILQFTDVFVGLRGGVSFYILFSRMVELTMQAIETALLCLPVSTVIAPTPISWVVRTARAPAGIRLWLLQTRHGPLPAVVQGD